MGKRNVKDESSGSSVSQQEQEASGAQVSQQEGNVFGSRVSFLHERVAKILSDYNALVQVAEQMEKYGEPEQTQISKPQYLPTAS